jgi:translation initiation factor 2B subunit (eIF-2B alpha/beta/delta family)
MFTAEFWTALERVGALVLLAALLWLGWLYISEREKGSSGRSASLVQFIQDQVKDAQQVQALYVTKLEETHKLHSQALADMLTNMIECNVTTNTALQAITVSLEGAGDRSGEEHEAIMQAVQSFDNLRESATQEHEAILHAIEALERRAMDGHRKEN